MLAPIRRDGVCASLAGAICSSLNAADLGVVKVAALNRPARGTEADSICLLFLRNQSVLRTHVDAVLANYPASDFLMKRVGPGNQHQMSSGHCGLETG